MAKHETDFEEVVEAIPSAREVEMRDHAWAIRVAEKLVALGPSKAILHRKRYGSEEVMVLRYELQRLGFRLISRTQPGESYFWRGEKLPESAIDTAVIHTKTPRKRKVVGATV